MLLSGEAYKVESDSLIYDSSQPISGTNIAVTLDGTSAGTIAKGQVLDAADGTYSIHAEGGAPSVIAAENADFAEGDTSVTIQAYTSGCLKQSRIVTDTELTAADIETLREKGIFLR